MSIESTLEKYGRIISDGIKDQFKSKRLNASGATSDSVGWQTKTDGNKSVLSILASWIIKALEKPGRARNKTGKPGRAQIEGIRRWIDDKGITTFNKSKDSMAWAIATKQAKLGTPVPNSYNPGGIMTDVLNDNLIENISTDLKQAMKDRIIQSFDDIPK